LRLATTRVAVNDRVVALSSATEGVEVVHVDANVLIPRCDGWANVWLKLERRGAFAGIKSSSSRRSTTTDTRSFTKKMRGVTVRTTVPGSPARAVLAFLAGGELPLAPAPGMLQPEAHR
jgi:hypothetical protein